MGEEEGRLAGISEEMREKAKKVLGVASARRKEDKETVVDEEVQDSTHRKGQSLAKSLAKKEMAKAKEKAYSALYEKLNGREGGKDPVPIDQAETVVVGMHSMLE